MLCLSLSSGTVRSGSIVSRSVIINFLFKLSRKVSDVARFWSKCSWILTALIFDVMLFVLGLFPATSARLHFTVSKIIHNHGEGSLVGTEVLGTKVEWERLKRWSCPVVPFHLFVADFRSKKCWQRWLSSSALKGRNWMTIASSTGSEFRVRLIRMPFPNRLPRLQSALPLLPAAMLPRLQTLHLREGQVYWLTIEHLIYFIFVCKLPLFVWVTWKFAQHFCIPKWYMCLIGQSQYHFFVCSIRIYSILWILLMI